MWVKGKVAEGLLAGCREQLAGTENSWQVQVFAFRHPGCSILKFKNNIFNTQILNF